MGEAIGAEFRAWGLAPAQAGVAGLLLKGAAMKEIAAARLGGDDPPAGTGHPPQGGLAGRAGPQACSLDSLIAEAENTRATLRALT